MTLANYKKGHPDHAELRKKYGPYRSRQVAWVRSLSGPEWNVFLTINLNPKKSWCREKLFKDLGQIMYKFERELAKLMLGRKFFEDRLRHKRVKFVAFPERIYSNTHLHAKAHIPQSLIPIFEEVLLLAIRRVYPSATVDYSYVSRRKDRVKTAWYCVKSQLQRELRDVYFASIGFGAEFLKSPKP